MALTQRDANIVIENIINEIKQYVEPEDIFDEDKLKAWAKAKEVLFCLMVSLSVMTLCIILLRLSA